MPATRANQKISTIKVYIYMGFIMGYLVIDIFFIVVKNVPSSSQRMKMFLSQGMSYAFYLNFNVSYILTLMILFMTVL